MEYRTKTIVADLSSLQWQHTSTHLQVRGRTMKQEQIFIFLPDEAQELLADNQIDLVKQLNEDGLDITQTYLSDPSASEQNKSRSLTLAILASGITISLIGTSISRILDAIGRNKKFASTEIRCVPATDAQGHVIRDKDGNVVMIWEEKGKLIEASQTSQGTSSHKGEFLGLKFEITSGK